MRKRRRNLCIVWDTQGGDYSTGGPVGYDTV